MSLLNSASPAAWSRRVVARAREISGNRLDRLVATFVASSGSANAFRAELPGAPGKVVTFKSAGDSDMIDNVSGTTWDRQSGRGIDGKWKGSQLVRLPAIPSFSKAWRDFHPDSAFYGE